MKPHIKFSPMLNSWVCHSTGLWLLGTTPSQALRRWQTACTLRALVVANT